MAKRESGGDRPNLGRPLRIVFCHYAADFGGGSDRSLFDVATHLPRDRFTPIMILRGGDPLAAAYRGAGIEVTELPLTSPRGKAGRFLLRFWPSVFRVASAIRRAEADLVHVNTLYNVVGGVAARLAGRPVVWHVREILPGSRAVAGILRLQALLATRAVAISNAVAHTMTAPPDRLRVIPNGIDLSDYDPPPDPGPVRAELGLEAGAPVVTTIGRIEPWKGQHVLVEAIPAILRTHPGAHVLIVGAAAVNKPEYEMGLKARCRDLAVAGRVIFAGPRSDIPAVLAASDLLVLPTVTPEPFGRTVVEAMAAGLPVVATAAGGPLDTVADGETGWLVPSGDPAPLAEKACELLGDRAQANAMGERGRRRAHALYSLDRLVGDMAALFEEVARPGAPGSGTS